MPIALLGHCPILQAEHCELLCQQLQHYGRQSRNETLSMAIFYYSKPGVKDIISHNPYNAKEQADALKRALEGIPNYNQDDGSLEIDVGLELTVANKVLLRLADLHATFACMAGLFILDILVVAICSFLNSCDFHINVCTQLYQCAGFHSRLPALFWATITIKLYTMDKLSTELFGKCGIFCKQCPNSIRQIR